LTAAGEGQNYGTRVHLVCHSNFALSVVHLWVHETLSDLEVAAVETADSFKPRIVGRGRGTEIFGASPFGFIFGDCSRSRYSLSA
jgi:hypothetical protein